ncbi:MAG: antitoxin of toxin-antitoxin stability system [bacterium]
MRTQKIEIYKFNELSEDAKETARAWYREGGFDYPWYDYVYEDVNTIAGLFGLEINTRDIPLVSEKTIKEPCIYFRGFSSQGDGACYEGLYEYKKGGLKAVKDYAPVDTELHSIAADLQAIQRRYFYGIKASTKHSGMYYHEYCMNVDADFFHPQGGYDYSLAVEDHDAITDALRRFAKWIYKQLESSFDSMNTDEASDEMLEINEYEFTADGNIY